MSDINCKATFHKQQECKREISMIEEINNSLVHPVNTSVTETAFKIVTIEPKSDRMQYVLQK